MSHKCGIIIIKYTLTSIGKCGENDMRLRISNSKLNE